LPAISMSGSGESWFEPRRGNRPRNDLGRCGALCFCQRCCFAAVSGEVRLRGATVVVGLGRRLEVSVAEDDVRLQSIAPYAAARGGEMKAVRQVALCPRCRTWVRKENLRSHINRIHEKESVPEVEIRRALATVRGSTSIVCPDCKRQLPFRAFGSHRCRSNSVWAYSGGGGPGTGKRR